MSLLDRDLECFLAICETQSIGRAGEALGLSQSAMTRTLQRLESRFGAKLFERAPRGVEITAIGEALRYWTERARVALDDGERQIAQLAAGKIGRVRIGSGHLPAPLVNRALFPRFIADRPAAKLQIEVAFNAELYGLLQAGSLDFAVCGLLDTLPAELSWRELLVTGMAVVVREGHPLTRLREPSVQDLVQFRGAAPGAGVRARQMIEARIAELGATIKPNAVECNSWETLLSAVASSDLYCMAPVHPAFRHSWESRLVAIPLPELDIKVRMGVVTRAGAYISPLAERAIGLIDEFFAEIAARDPSGVNGKVGAKPA